MKKKERIREKLPVRNGLEKEKEDKKEKRVGRKKRRKNGLLTRRDGRGRGHHEGDGL